MHEEVELEIKRRLGAGDAVGAATEAVRFYGPEIFGFLVGVLGDSETSRDVYACFNDRIVRELPGFSWTRSLRTWAYAGARAELAAHRKRCGQAAGAPQTLGSGPAPTSTISYRPTNVRGKIATLRARLEPEDRELLILRLDRGLDWKELALTSLGQDAAPLEIEREAMRLRSRFAALRNELAQSARLERLIGPE